MATAEEQTSDISTKCLQMAAKCVRAANALPAGADYNYYSAHPEVRQLLQAKASKSLSIVNQLLRHTGIRTKLYSEVTQLDLEEFQDRLVDVNDQIFESVSTYLDEAKGVKKNDTSLVVVEMAPRTEAAPWNQQKNRKSTTPAKLLAAKNIQRPQLQFADKVDNANSPFILKLKTKHNAIVPLHESLAQETPEDRVHPYRPELAAFQPRPWQLEHRDAVYPAPMEETPYLLVENVAQLDALLADLREATIFAIDLENHSFRSFQGFSCLMQISTGEKDWLVDSLALREHLHQLNEVFTDPDILKIFHGSEQDIQWLQRDFGVYVVNEFDTFHAAKALTLGRYSLAHLLQRYCDLEADKQYQMADWRIRPLPEELVNYARMDVHFLPYIFQRLTNELLARGDESLLNVYAASTRTCLNTYQKPLFTPDSHLMLLQRTKKIFNKQQMTCFRLIHEWRDTVSRQDDESTGYVLPNHMLLSIAEILPREAAGVLACCNPVPPLVKQYLAELHRMSLRAREVPLDATTESLAPITVVSASNVCQWAALHLSTRHDTVGVKTRTIGQIGEFPMRKPTGISTIFRTAQVMTTRKSKLFTRTTEIEATIESPLRGYMTRQALQPPKRRAMKRTRSEPVIAIPKTPQPEPRRLPGFLGLDEEPLIQRAAPKTSQKRPSWQSPGGSEQRPRRDEAAMIEPPAALSRGPQNEQYNPRRAVAMHGEQQQNVRKRQGKFKGRQFHT